MTFHELVVCISVRRYSVHPNHWANLDMLCDIFDPSCGFFYLNRQILAVLAENMAYVLYVIIVSRVKLKDWVFLRLNLNLIFWQIKAH